MHNATAFPEPSRSANRMECTARKRIPKTRSAISIAAGAAIRSLNFPIFHHLHSPAGLIHSYIPPRLAQGVQSLGILHFSFSIFHLPHPLTLSPLRPLASHPRASLKNHSD